MNIKTLCYLLLLPLLSVQAAFAAEPHLTLYLPFDGSIQPQIAAGKTPVKFGKDQTPQFAEGISGQGLITGGNDQNVIIDAKDNLPADQWTISFWMKGLANADWNGGKYLETFWTLNGTDGGMMYFYHYMKGASPWLYSRRDVKSDYLRLVAPAAPEKDWHNWVVTWRQGSGAYLYLDGRLIGQSPTQPPDPVKTITVGQGTNKFSPPEPNKIIDEFKIYDTVLDAGTIARNYWQEGNIALHPTMTIPRATHHITVDGKIDAQEWQNAAGFSGLINQNSRELAAPRTWGKIAYDDENIYFAVHSGNPPEAKENPDATVQHGIVKKDAVKRDGNVNDDDSFFFQLQPQNGEGNSYFISANGIDTVYDAQGKNVAWNSGATVKSSIDVGGWSMEIAIPLQSLGIQNIADGSVWRANFGRVWQQLRQGTDVWEPNGLGSMQFSDKSSAIADLQQLEFAPGGKINATINAINPGVSPQNITVTLTAAGETLREEKVLLQPGKNQVIHVAASPTKANGALISAAVQDGEKVLLRQSAPLILDSVGQIALWRYPSLGKIRLGWAISADADPKALQLDAQIIDSNGNVAQKIALDRLPSLHDSTMADVKSLAPGQYDIKVKISDGENTLQQQILVYDKKSLPSWLGNKLGISDTPPPPWTDVKVDVAKDAVSIWGRTYDYAKKLLPVQIINQGKTMLAAPMRFAVKSSGETQNSDASNAQSKWTKTVAVRADTQRQQKMGDVQISSTSYTEFDGMTWNEFTVEPQGKVLLDSLILEVPLKKEWAELIRPYNDYRLNETGVLSAKGWKGHASQMPWIGNGSGGIQLFQETTATWIGSKTTEVVPQNNGTIMLRIHIVDTPTTLDKPLHFALGWIASPVKAAPRDHRDWRMVSSGGVTSGSGLIGKYLQEAVKVNPAIRPYFPWWQGWWMQPEGFTGNPDQTGVTPVPRADLAKDVGIFDFEGTPIPRAAYTRLTGLVGTENPWFAQFGDEWVTDTAKFTPDNTLPAAKRSATVSQASSSLRDYYLWGIDQLLSKTNTKAIYYDVSRPIDDTNIYHGAGVQMPDGTIEPTRNILGMREAFKRIYTLVKQHHLDGKVFYHMSGEIMLPVDSFADALIDGENYHALLDRKNNRGYENVLSVDQFRAEYSAQNNFGPASVLLPQFERARSINKDEWNASTHKHVDYIMGLVFLHNSNLWWSFLPYDHVAKIYSAFDKTGLNADWKFVPYWEQKYVSLPQGVYASSYQSPDGNKVLFVAMNTSGGNQEVDLPMTLDKSTFAQAHAVYPEQKMTPQDTKLKVNIANNSFAAYLLQK